MLGFIDIYFFKYSLVADHWQYFSIAGLIALLVGAVTAGAGRAAGLGLCVRGGFGFWAHGADLAANRELRDGRNLRWRDALKKNPTCFLARNNLGLILEKQQKPAEAEALFRAV